ncbi:uncharacterized protein [Zea mays]|jgi:hypothetical protein|uniref:DUF4228 domain protein n=1 Tax=Zea mays TaxID=4577 RepID=A0A1D6LBR5_MAIZE|nr:uncharacterized protein LOC118476195 [Zea mays]ONM11540.1 hypothetical protein ZEAMMB73_Zm00001d034827 [Zea mays]
MAHGATVPLGKSMRRALRTAIGIPKKNKPPPPPLLPNGSGRDPGVSMELSSSSSVAARKEAVVRVVMRGGVVEVYPGVVLACTVIRNHPPGLCLAHPDVFRNPHGAVVRPLEPLFPGQKFLLLPETTVVRLKQRIPESSIGAFADEEEYGDEDETSSSSSSSEADEVGAMTACSARDYFVARDRWSECRFRRLVEQGFAVEPSKDGDDDDDEPAEREKDRARATTKKGNRKRRKGRRRRDRRSSPVPQLLPVGLRGFATARRTWEPSLPSVEEEEEEAAVSPRHRPPSGANKRSCMNRYQ